MKPVLKCSKNMHYLLEHIAVNIAAITGVLVTAFGGGALLLQLAGIKWRIPLPMFLLKATSPEKLREDN